MKKYRFLVPIILIILMLASWYTLISDTVKVNSQYEAYLNAARKFAKDGITKYAIENYNQVLKIKSTIEVYDEVAEYYKSQDNTSEYLTWCKDFFETYPRDTKSYDRLLDAYMTEKDYTSCYDVLETAEKRNISSEYIKNVAEQIKYEFELEFNTYDDVGVYSNNYCAVLNKNVWGFVDRYGKQRISCKYLQVGAFTKSNFASVVNTNNEAYFIDKSGLKVLPSREFYKSFGLLIDGLISVEKKNGKYIYINQDFEELISEFDYASSFNNGIAAVKNEEKWSLINTEGNKISDESYMDIKLDEKKIAYRNERIFVSINEGKYKMVDGKGNQIGKLEFEDAMPFFDETYASVKIDGKWTFVNKNGELISDKTYDLARSFSNGLAAVCINGNWGFIDETEDIVIEPQFFDAKDFNEIGSCFVQTDDKWQLLKLYRLNREG